MHKPLVKKIAFAKKEHKGYVKGKLHNKLKSCHKRHYSLGKHHVGMRNMFSPRTASQNSRGSGRSVLLKMPKVMPRNAA
eukprot:15356203-Ditylum_brightwellii.AAC.2